MTPIYTASAMLRIATTATGATTDYMYADRLMKTYVKMATTQPVLDELMQKLELNSLPQIKVEIVSQTELLQIEVEHQDPILAANIANTLAEILISQSTELYSGGGKSSQEILNEQLTEMEKELNQAREAYTNLVAQNPNDSVSIQAAKQLLDSRQEIYATVLEQYEQTRIREALREKSISIVEPALPPVSPSQPRKVLNVALGFMVSLMGGVGLSFLIENLDTTLYTTEQIEEATKLPSLGMVPNADVRDKLISMDGNNPYGEAFRHLRTNIFALNHDSPHHTLLVTSSDPGEGKSTLVTNLAFVLAQSGGKVVVIDCDMRRPTQHKIFNLHNSYGLSNVLLKKMDVKTALQESTVPGVQVLTSGPLPRNPAELLGSPQMSELITRLRQRYDTVLLDTPAMLSVTDAVVLAPTVDGVILVVSRSQSRREGVRSACRQLADVKARILGVVINRAEQNRSYYYYDRKKYLFKK